MYHIVIICINLPVMFMFYLFLNDAVIVMNFITWIPFISIKTFVFKTPYVSRAHNTYIVEA